MDSMARLALLLVFAVHLAAGSCPPKGFDSAAEFNLQKYIQGPWYPQEQMITAYQRESQLYCVRAVYTPNDPNNLRAGIQVINSARQGSVTGPLVGSTGSGAASSCNSLFGGSFSIVAYPDSSSSGPTTASKLSVGPSFLSGLYNSGPRQTFGPYWVVAVGRSADGNHYDWAIVSGGPPDDNSRGCVSGPLNPGPFDVNGAGLWLFSRKPVDPANTAIMRVEAARLGFDVSVLKKVQQQGCSYTDAAAAQAGSSSSSGFGFPGGLKLNFNLG